MNDEHTFIRFGRPKKMHGRVCIGVIKWNDDPSVQEHVFLTRKEQNVLAEIANNETTIGIAMKMKLSPKTVEYHRSEIYRKLRVSGTAALTKIALMLKLTRLHHWV